MSVPVIIRNMRGACISFVFLIKYTPLSMFHKMMFLQFTVVLPDTADQTSMPGRHRTKNFNLPMIRDYWRSDFSGMSITFQSTENLKKTQFLLD